MYKIVKNSKELLFFAMQMAIIPVWCKITKYGFIGN